MDLALSSARADGSPTNQACDVLRRNHVEEFCSCGHADFSQVEQQTSRQPQAIVDLEGPVKMRIVDEPFPADRCPRLFKVHTHDEAEVGGKLLDRTSEEACIFASCVGVVNRTRAREHEQPVVAAVENGGDLLTCIEYGVGGCLRNRHLFFKKY